MGRAVARRVVDASINFSENIVCAIYRGPYITGLQCNCAAIWLLSDVCGRAPTKLNYDKNRANGPQLPLACNNICLSLEGSSELTWCSFVAFMGLERV